MTEVFSLVNWENGAGNYRIKGESERKVVWEKDNELRSRDVEFGNFVGRLGGDDSKYLKMCITGPQSPLFQPGTFLRDGKQMAANCWPPYI